MSVIGTDVAAVEEMPIGFRDIGAGQSPESDTRVEDLASFLPDLLALVMAHLREESIERRVIRIVPMKLNSRSQQHALLTHFQCFIFGWKKTVKGGKTGFLGQPNRRIDQRFSVAWIAHQQARSAHWREWN